jgi:F-type H+-transporting ATPase subunit b
MSLGVMCFVILPALASDTEHAEKGGGLPQFDPSSWASQIFWLTITFIVLYIVFGRSVIPTLGQTIQNRHDYIANAITQAENLSKQAETLKEEMDNALKSAGQSASAYMTEADQEGKTKLANALSVFREKYEQKIAESEKSIESAKLKALQEMDEIAVRLSAQAAEKIAGISASQSDANNIVKSLRDKTKIAA